MHKSFGHWMELYFEWIQNDKKKELPHAHSHHNASSFKYVLSDSSGVVTPISLLTVSFQMKLIIINIQYSYIHAYKIQEQKTKKQDRSFFRHKKEEQIYA